MCCIEVLRNLTIFAFFSSFIALLIVPIQNLRNPQIGVASYGSFDGHLPSITVCPYSRNYNITTFGDLKELPSLKEHVNVTIANYFKDKKYRIDDAVTIKEEFGLSPDEISKEHIVSQYGGVAKCLNVNTPFLQENWQVL